MPHSMSNTTPIAIHETKIHYAIISHSARPDHPSILTMMQTAPESLSLSHDVLLFGRRTFYFTSTCITSMDAVVAGRRCCHLNPDDRIKLYWVSLIAHTLAHFPKKCGMN